MSSERNGKKKGESPGRVDLGKRKTKRHAATKAAKKVQKVFLYQRSITAGSALFWGCWIRIRISLGCWIPWSEKPDPDPH
jgi:hypothetical protein